MKQQPELIRGLGLIASAAIVVGSVIGTGIFLVPADIAREVDSVGLVFAVWIVGGLLSLAGALSYAELGAAMPEAGGEYVFLRRAYGPLWGFLYGWEQFVIGKTGSVASIATAFAVFLGYFFGTLSQPAVELGGWTLNGAQLVSLAAIIGLTVINYLGIIVGGAVQTVFTILKVVIILGLVVLGFAIGNGSWSNFAPFFAAPKGSATVGAFGVALLSAFWAYDGWNNLTMVGSEIKDPQRNIPRSLIFGMLGVGAVYMLANAVYFYILPLGDVKNSERVAQDAAVKFLGGWGGAAITVGALISTFATLNSAILSGARVAYAMARDKLFFTHVADVHPVHRSPAKALLLQCAFACLLVLIFGGSKAAFQRLYTYTLFGLWIFYTMATAAVFVLRKKEPDLPRPYKTLGYPWIPGAFVVMATIICLNTLISSPKEAGLGLVFLAAGLPFYWFWKRRQQEA
ncbi:MAG TPA: amino acid permease [Candidatus Acidoferrales bacterium]|nr:amino acid permease [Candidatus Acidoferrales bacterium]